MNLKKLVLDVVKGLNKPTLVELADEIVKIKGVADVKISVSETDMEVMGLTVTIDGDGIEFDNLIESVEESGCAIRSIDEVVVTKAASDPERSR